MLMPNLLIMVADGFIQGKQSWELVNKTKNICAEAIA